MAELAGAVGWMCSPHGVLIILAMLAAFAYWRGWMKQP